MLLATGIMIPVGGAIARAIAIAYAGIDDATRLAVTVPPGELTALGAWPVLLTGVAMLAGLILARARLLDAQAIPAKSIRRADVRAIILVTVGTFVAGPVLASLLGIPLAGAILLTGVVTYWFSVREVVSPIRGWRLVVLLLVVYGGSSFIYGLSSAGKSPPLTLFTDAPGIELGPAIRLAEDDDWVFVTWCDARGTVSQIPKLHITSMAWPAHTSRDWEERLREITQPSIYAGCP